MKRWGKMAVTFTRIGREIALAVRAGGPEPEVNSRLRAAIQNARAANMPKDNVEAAIKRASSKGEKDLEELVYEGYAPHGIAVVIETATDNPTRTVANVRMYFNRAGGSLGKTGSLDFLFERKCVFTINAQGVDTDSLELDLIDAGLEELDVDPETQEAVLTGDFTAFGALQKVLEEKGLQIISSELQRIPLNYTDLSPEAAEEVYKMLERIEEDEDVQNVFHNMRETES